MIGVRPEGSQTPGTVEEYRQQGGGRARVGEGVVSVDEGDVVLSAQVAETVGSPPVWVEAAGDPEGARGRSVRGWQALVFAGGREEGPVEVEVVGDGGTALEPTVEFGDGLAEWDPPSEGSAVEAVNLAGADARPRSGEPDER